ncbi:MAG: AAA family ATPase [Roseofilum sp. SBFL]|uniref:NB-ARC domain-containing protein n=1 Tax=unclassified Roseofilum TaxID=2620099 RepID=UPI001B260CC7|nr:MULTISPECIES: NB-ARC domain-containing protein [unclassified Roseofilum]MBP0012274.1 AAA family ATPase [Roseofilum sp. SID3]MBP0022900.1 AAA family ATPase [Roseofilum sp. SID2]MBP0037176.1 AAA family ATPase [Roseofilum sp. SID1]MBP0041642.1 AAA family ATPase [Roseofilum sp. SBFL]
MDIQEVLQLTDALVFAKTGQHLYSLQKAILEGTWNGKKYPEIAEACNRDYDHVRKVAGELWKLISEELGEKIGQSNFRAAMERYQISNIFNYGKFIQSHWSNIISVCGEGLHSTEVTKNRTTANPDSVSPKKLYNLIDAPKYDRLKNRTAELTTLKQWILEDHTPIAIVTGLPGIGKTALALELVEQTKETFDRILWRSHGQFLSLSSLQTNIIEFFSEGQTPTERPLLDYLRSHPSLIVLDDMEEVFIPGELAGTYRSEYENYGKFLKQLATFPHQSCLLLLSQEKPIDFAALEVENCRSLQLKGLGASAEEILQSRELNDRDRWLELIERYSGNPSWLKLVAATLVELFNGNVAKLLSCPTVFLGDLEPILRSHYQRLSDSEQLTLSWLAAQDEAVEMTKKPEELPFSQQDFWQALKSLQRRCAIEKATGDRNHTSSFTLEPVIKEYVKNQY